MHVLIVETKLPCVECGDRNARAAVDKRAVSAAGDYDTLDLQTRRQQHHYDVMPCDQQNPYEVTGITV